MLDYGLHILGPFLTCLPILRLERTGLVYWFFRVFL